MNRDSICVGDHGSGARFTQGMRESVLVTLTAIALFMAGSVLLPKRDEPMEGRPAATTPPKSVLPLSGSYLLGGMPRMGRVQRGEGAAGGVGIACVCSLHCGVAFD